MSQSPDLRTLLDSWPYDPGRNVRLARGEGAREFMVVRQPRGLELYEVNGRPDGWRPYGMDSVLERELGRLAAARRAGAEYAFKLSAEKCAELFDEGTLYYHRFVNFFQLKDWVRAERDTARTRRLMDFVQVYGEHEEDRMRLEQWRHHVTRMNAVARAMILLERGQADEALTIARDSIEEIEGIGEELRGPGKLAEALIQGLGKSIEVSPALRPREGSVFILQGDYWTIIYQGKTERLKATRGLYCLACLLRHPGREFHVSDLLIRVADVPKARTAGQTVSRVGGARDTDPILDAQAKAEYVRRLEELRGDLAAAKQLNDSEQASKAQEEMNLIADQIAAAVGLGGRDRRTGSEAERARSAVTKRIKGAISQIDEVMPLLGRHLAVRIKTGHFCSYNPHPDRPVAWKF